MSAPRVILLMGATATGKTDLAVEIAKRFPVELISVDSALIYRGMDIGTAKPDAELLSRAPHFLIDIIDPAEYYSAWHFVQDVRQLIQQIKQRENIPLLVGGTMMYFHALENGLNELPVADPSIRAKLNHEACKIGWSAMHDRLSTIDPVSASRIKPGDSQRIQRALEVFKVSGQSLSDLQNKVSEGLDMQATRIILNAEDRAQLHNRIQQRFEKMLQQGFIDEVADFKMRGDLNLDMPSMRCVGYRQIWQYLEGNLNKEDMIYRAVVATRQLAKRQMTWLRKQPQNNAFDCLNYQQAAIFKVLDDMFPNK